ncbi:hypothetical protein LCI18_004290 [Fusarium solani-melongenae]|uniref:Uncharacterized protein n=1 Tax=Fusarium solani subsp. cucurbitae TaxID=2747967 RepID=A0ACD3YWU3_FUSSC|nr:hypothetical protein LCI18_004290 [Fusarium solani-melongenae]
MADSWDTPIQTRPDDGGSWFELSMEPNSFITLTTAVVPTVEPTGLAEETPSKGTTPWLYATVGCIIVIVFLLIIICLQWMALRQVRSEDKSRKEAERRVETIMGNNPTARIKGRSPPTETTKPQRSSTSTKRRTIINMSVHVMPRSVPEDNNSTIMVVTVSAGLMLIVMGIIGYVIFVAKPRPVRDNANDNANGGRPARNGANPVRTLHYTNGPWERFPQAPITEGFAVQYLRYILQRARAVTGRDRAPDNEAQDQNANGHGQTSGGQGHDGPRPATA